MGGIVGANMYLGDVDAIGVFPVGGIFQMPSNVLPPRSLRLNGAEVNRAAYKELWAFAEASGNIIADTDWLALAAEQSSVGQFSYGDGAATFRLPEITDFLRGLADGEDIGRWQGDAIRNITGRFSSGNDWAVAGISETLGAFVAQNPLSLYFATNGSSRTYNTIASFDASRVVPTADENRPKNIAYPWFIKAF